MTDWTGTTSFEVDLPNRITKTTDRKGNVVGYTYGEVDNLTYETGHGSKSVDYNLNNLNQVTSSDDGKRNFFIYIMICDTTEPQGGVL